MNLAIDTRASAPPPERGGVRHINALDLQIAYRETEGHEPVFLVHGNWSSQIWWEPIQARLGQRGARAIAYDLRGRGDTQGPDNDYSIGAHARDLLALADALGVERFHLAGHSLGSAIALETARCAPLRVRSLALLSPSWIDGMPALFHNAVAQAALASPVVLDRALVALSPSLVRDELWRRCVEGGAKQRVSAAIANLDALTAWRPGDELRELSMPRAVLTGALDTLTGGAVARRVAEVLDTELVVVSEVGHCLPLEAPAACADAIAALMR